MSSDRGAGAVLALALLAATALLALAACALGAGLTARQRVIGAADSAALAAADAVRGIVSGVPCEVAGRVAAANGAVLSGCAIDGDVATVELADSWGGIALVARSRAGPPP